MKRPFRNIILPVLGLALFVHYVSLLSGNMHRSADTSTAPVNEPAGILQHGGKYFCPMHPEVVLDKPGICPVCHMQLQLLEIEPPAAKKPTILFYRHPMGKDQTSPVPIKDEMGMDYIPVYSDEASGNGESAAAGGRVSFSLPADAQQRIGVTTGAVVKTDLQYDIRASGRVVYDPQLYTAVKEFEVARKLGTNNEGSQSGGIAGAAATRLKLLGLSPWQIEEIRRGDVSADEFLLPKGRIWIYADVYEFEVAAVKIGQKAEVSSPANSDHRFEGTIRGINPVLDPATRTLKVRIEVQDPDGVLTPEAFVNVNIHVNLGESLAVQEDAIIHTGNSDLVFVVENGSRFIPREVALGIKARGFYQVKSGLTEGERVVTAANFLIDSESRLKAVVRGLPAAAAGETRKAE